MMLARLYPAGIIDEQKPRALIQNRWTAGLGKHGNKEGLELKFIINRNKGRMFMLKEIWKSCSRSLRRWERGRTGFLERRDGV
jgi:hypothetical protein